MRIQEELKKGTTTAKKMSGKVNPADLMAKHVSGQQVKKHVETMAFSIASGRANESLTINAILLLDKDRWTDDT